MSVHFLEIKKNSGRGRLGTIFFLETDDQTDFLVVEGKSPEEVIVKLGKAFSSAIERGDLFETDTLNVKTPDGKNTELSCTIN